MRRCDRCEIRGLSVIAGLHAGHVREWRSRRLPGWRPRRGTPLQQRPSPCLQDTRLQPPLPVPTVTPMKHCPPRVYQPRRRRGRSPPTRRGGGGRMRAWSCLACLPAIDPPAAAGPREDRLRPPVHARRRCCLQMVPTIAWPPASPLLLHATEGGQSARFTRQRVASECVEGGHYARTLLCRRRRRPPSPPWLRDRCCCCWRGHIQILIVEPVQTQSSRRYRASARAAAHVARHARRACAQQGVRTCGAGAPSRRRCSHGCVRAHERVVPRETRDAAHTHKHAASASEGQPRVRRRRSAGGCGGHKRLGVGLDSSQRGVLLLLPTAPPLGSGACRRSTAHGPPPTTAARPAVPQAALYPIQTTSTTSPLLACRRRCTAKLAPSSLAAHT